MTQQDAKGNNAKRIAILFIVAVLIGVVFLFANKSLNSLSDQSSTQSVAAREIMEQDAARSALLGTIQDNAEQGEANLAFLFFHAKQEDRISNYKEMDKHDNAINKSIDNLSPLITKQEEKDVLSQMVTLRQTYRENLLDAVGSLESGDREDAENIFSQSLLSNLQELKALTAKLVRGVEEATNARNAASKAEKSRTKSIIIGLGVAASIIILLLGIVLLRRIAKSE